MGAEQSHRKISHAKCGRDLVPGGGEGGESLTGLEGTGGQERAFARAAMQRGFATF